MKSTLFRHLPASMNVDPGRRFRRPAGAPNCSRLRSPLIQLAVAAYVLAAPGGALASLVDLSFAPTAQTVATDDIVEIDIIASSNDGTDVPFGVVIAILNWDPALLELAPDEPGSPNPDSSNAGYDWALESLLDLGDGIAVYSALPQINQAAVAPSAPGLVVTTIRFRALAETMGTDVSYIESVDPYITRIFRFDLPNVSITGDISSTVSVQVLCGPPGFGDVNGDGEINMADVATAVQVLLGIDMASDHRAAVDADCNGEADGRDIQPLIDLILR